MTLMPQVSINMPCYNDSQWLDECLHSILTQTYQDFEIIIVDDGSTDNSKQIIQKYLDDDRIRYFYQNNEGFSGATNRGLKESKGRYISFISPDDLWLPHKLEKQVSFLEKNKNIDMVHSDVYHIDSEGKIIKQRRPNISKNISKKELINGLFLRSIKICHQTVMIRKDCFKEVGFFDNKIIASDYDMWIRLANKHNIDYIDEPLTKKRFHKNQLMAKNMEQIFKDDLLVIDKATLLYPFLIKYKKKKIAEINYRWGVLLLLKNKKTEAKKQFSKSLKMNPFSIRNYFAYLLPTLYIKVLKLKRI
jgi:glycosyltransferase involved in cell wall biosynthesis